MPYHRNCRTEGERYPHAKTTERDNRERYQHSETTERDNRER